MTKKSLGIALSVILGLIAAELLLERSYYSKRYSYYEAAEVYWEDQHTHLLYLPHRTLFWSLKPNIRLAVAERVQGFGLRAEQRRAVDYEWEIEVGPKGHRGADFPARKPAGELRVACLGDSRTLGEGLAEGETYPVQLESMLRRARGSDAVRVLNLGADGWSSHQGRVLLESQALDWAPDVVVVAFGINDGDTEWGFADVEKAEQMDSAYYDVQRALYRSMVFYWLQRQFLHLRGVLLGKTPVSEAGDGGPPRVSPEEYGLHLQALAGMCREHGILPIVLILPLNPHSDWSAVMSSPGPDGGWEEHYRKATGARDAGDLNTAHALFTSALEHTLYARYNEVARGRAAAHGMLLLDLSSGWLERSRREPLFIDDMHPSRLGARRIAESLARAINGALGPGPDSGSR